MASSSAFLQQKGKELETRIQRKYDNKCLYAKTVEEEEREKRKTGGKVGRKKLRWKKYRVRENVSWYHYHAK